jgi:hypothetical protein
VFNFIGKANVETSEEFIINVFSYMLKDIALDWCHNYMSEFLDHIFSKLTHAFCKRHWNIQNDKQIYIELKNMKQEEIKGWRFIMKGFRSWFMVYKYQPQIVS